MLEQLQGEHKLWVDANFPEQPAMLPAAGMVEEAGELLHAVIAIYRIAKWGSDPRYPVKKLHEDLVDAIGDCAIYACSYCNAAGLTFIELLKERKDKDAVVAVSKDNIANAIELVATAAKFFASESRTLLKDYMLLLRKICAECNQDFESCVNTTWYKVKYRRRA